MEPMKPMKPMEPMSGGEQWWPNDLGEPSSTGSQNGMRYAFFFEGAAASHRKRQQIDDL